MSPDPSGSQQNNPKSGLLKRIPLIIAGTAMITFGTIGSVGAGVTIGGIAGLMMARAGDPRFDVIALVVGITTTVGLWSGVRSMVYRLINWFDED